MIEMQVPDLKKIMSNTAAAPNKKSGALLPRFSDLLRGSAAVPFVVEFLYLVELFFRHALDVPLVANV
jgi:hypothetical protein